MADCCLAEEMQPTLLSILDIYGGRLANRKIRFKMYLDAVKHVHGPDLRKAVRRKLPDYISSLIRRLAPDDKYTGFDQSAKS